MERFLFFVILRMKEGSSVKQNPKRVLTVMIGSVFFFAILVYLFLPKTNQKISNDQEKKGQEILDELEKLNPNDIQEEIDQVSPSPSTTPSSSPSASKQPTSGLPLAKRFSRSLIMGDSIIEAISDYSLLNANQVIGVRGKRVDNIIAQLDQAISLSPTTIFMEYGSNDVESFLGNTDYYIRHYKKDIEYLKAKLEGVQIYVLAILPVQNWVVKKNSAFQYLPLYNVELEKMCQDGLCTFIDTQSMLTEDLYESDGVHPVYRFYKPWLMELATRAGL